MKCEEIKQLLSAYIDDEASEGERQLVEAHLLGCADCAATLSRLRRVAGEVADMDRLKLPELAAGRLEAAVQSHLAAGRPPERRQKPAPRWQWFARPAFVSAAAAIGAVAVALVVWQGPVEETKLPMKTAPTIQGAPEAKMLRKSLGAPGSSDFPQGSNESLDKDHAASVFTKKQINELAKAADTPAYDGEGRDWGLSARPEASKTDNALEAAARLAASNRPATLVSATQGLFEDRLVWVVVVELNEGGKRIGAAIAVDDGRLLYQTK